MSFQTDDVRKVVYTKPITAIRCRLQIRVLEHNDRPFPYDIIYWTFCFLLLIVQLERDDVLILVFNGG